MTRHHRGSALLVEIVLVVLFCILSASVLIRMFFTAYSLTGKAEIENAALLEGQNLAEKLYAAEDPKEMLRSDGFTEGEEGWTLVMDGYMLKVSDQKLEAPLRGYLVEAVRGEETLLSLPSVRCMPGEVKP